MNKNYNFDFLNDTDLTKAYSILKARVYDLIRKGNREYKHPYPLFNAFAERQKNNHNFALYEKDRIACIISIIPNHKPDVWEDEFDCENFIWFTSLFTNPTFKGKNYGLTLLKEAENYARSKNFDFAYLDCYTGTEFLPNYYKKEGYEILKDKKVKYPTNEFKASLMLKNLNRF